MPSRSRDRLIDPARLSEKAIVLEETVPVAAFARLAESLANDAGELHYRVSAGLDRQRRKVVSCIIEGFVFLTCQATLDTFRHPLSIEERLVQYRAKANQDLIANPTGIDSKLAQLLGFASMGDGPPTDGSKDLLKRLTDGISERSVAVEGVEKKEMAALTKLANSMLKK